MTPSRSEEALTMSLLGATRYGVAPAPEGLSAIQELLNTVATGKSPGPDLLLDPALADEWLRELHRTASSDPGSLSPGALTEAELRRLRALRSSIAAAVSGAEPVAFSSTVDLSMGASGRVDATAPHQPAEWLMSSVMMETLLAQRSGEWSRLKICGNPDCDVSFFDRSKNRSGVWHDVHACGNAINLRASRSRRRAGTQPGS
jgi:predicted RNA-binding Zn ribbon-like protein